LREKEKGKERERGNGGESGSERESGCRKERVYQREGETKMAAKEFEGRREDGRERKGEKL
jgi:hypothetical protein